MTIETIPGRNAGNIMLYALSTCPWCRKTKDLFKELGVAYKFVDVDLLPDGEKASTMDDVKKCNPTISFPTILINDKCIVGFRESEIRETLK